VTGRQIDLKTSVCLFLVCAGLYNLRIMKLLQGKSMYGFVIFKLLATWFMHIQTKLQGGKVKPWRSFSS